MNAKGVIPLADHVAPFRPTADPSPTATFNDSPTPDLTQIELARLPMASRRSLRQLDKCLRRQSVRIRTKPRYVRYLPHAFRVLLSWLGGQSLGRGSYQDRRTRTRTRDPLLLRAVPEKPGRKT